MADKDQQLKEVLEHSGVFDFKGLYSFAHTWLKDERYEVYEERYSEKVVGNAREIAIEWKCTKKLSDYFGLEIGVRFIIGDMVDVEIEIDGKRKKSNKGRIRVEIKGTLIKDRENKWEETAFMRLLRESYNKYIIPSRIDSMEDMVKGNVRGFKEELKNYLELTARR
jgi:hypothetical protein